MMRFALPTAITPAAAGAGLLAWPGLDLAFLVWASVGLFGLVLGFASVQQARTAHRSGARPGGDHAVVRPSAAARTLATLGAGMPQTVPQPAGR